VANAGGLGILAAATMTYEALRAAIDEVRSRTDAPFGVNLRADATDAPERVRLLIDRGVRVASFALAPSERLIGELKDAGVVVIPSVGAVRHAEKVAGWGADAVVVQGGEGGGHTGPVATTLLLPAVIDAVDIPVVAAGGFYDGRGLAAALAYGAAGVAMGTRFLLTAESTVPDAVKSRYLTSTLADTVVTTSVDGVPHRVLRSPLVTSLEEASRPAALARAVRNATKFRRLTNLTWRSMLKDGLAMRHNRKLTWSQVIMAANTPMLLREGLVNGNPEAGVLAAGQVVGAITDLPTCQDLITTIVRDAETTLTNLARLALNQSG